jgi:hypothetical protein
MRLSLPAAVAAVLVFAGAAGAGPVNDPAGDSKPGHADIRSVSVQLSAQSDVWTIVTYKAFATLYAPCVDVSTVHPVGAINWYICGTAASGFGMSTSAPYQAGGGYAGRAGVSRPNGSTIVYRVPRKTFELASTTLRPKPLGVAWQVQVRDTPGCFPVLCDRAPDSAHVSFQP